VNESAALDTEAGNFERISLQRTGHVFSEFGQKSKEIGFQVIIGFTSKLTNTNINVIFITKHVLKYSDLKELHLLCTTILSL
jgi:hypothetical protein